MSDYIPDDSYYYIEPEFECDGSDWERCPCESCQDIRDGYDEECYQRMRDSEIDKGE